VQFSQKGAVVLQRNWTDLIKPSKLDVQPGDDAKRFAKAVAVVVSLGITSLFGEFSSLRWLSGFTIAVIVLWIFAARYAGRSFQKMTQGD